MTEGRQHIDYFDWLRAVGCAAVVLLHVLSIYIDGTPVSADVSRMLWSCEANLVLTRWAVPVFLMMSGALLLDERRTMSYGKALVYAGRMAAVLATFGFAYCVMEAAYGGSENPVARGLENLVCGRSWNHMWYVYAMLGIYMLLPVFKAFADAASDGDYRILLVVLFVFSCVVPFVNGVLALSLEQCVCLTSSCFYIFLGRYLHDRDWRVGRSVAIGLCSALLAVLVVARGVLGPGVVWKWAWSIESPFVVAYASSIFVVARSVFERRAGRVVRSISARSFGIYVVHPLFLNLMFKVCGWDRVPLCPPLFELVTFAVVFAASYVLSWALARLPLFAWMRF